MKNQILKTSLAVTYKDTFLERSRFCMHILTLCWKKSTTYGIICTVSGKLDTCVQNSVLAEIKRWVRTITADKSMPRNSVTVESFLKNFSRIENGFIRFFKTSYCGQITEKIQKNLVSSPLNKIGVFLLSVSFLFGILFLKAFFNLEPGRTLYDWIVLLLLSLSGIGCVLCPTRWENLQKSSLSLKLINTYCKI